MGFDYDMRKVTERFKKWGDSNAILRRPEDSRRSQLLPDL
jgi:hypothetical protein